MFLLLLLVVGSYWLVAGIPLAVVCGEEWPHRQCGDLGNAVTYVFQKSRD